MLSLLLSFSAAAENLESAPVAELSVASINIWGLSWPIAKQRGQRMRALDSLALDSYDVVGMQEVWRGAYRRIPWRERIQRPTDRGDSGLALTGRLPLLTAPILVPFAASAGVTAPLHFCTKADIASAAPKPSPPSDGGIAPLSTSSPPRTPQWPRAQ